MSTVDDAIICSCGGAGMKVSEVLVKLHTFLVRSTEQLAYAKWMGAGLTPIEIYVRAR